MIRSMCLMVAAELEGDPNGRDDGRTLFQSQPRLSEQYTRINSSQHRRRRLHDLDLRDAQQRHGLEGEGDAAEADQAS